jgi:hypothetical protein
MKISVNEETARPEKILEENPIIMELKSLKQK